MPLGLTAAAGAATLSGLLFAIGFSEIEFDIGTPPACALQPGEPLEPTRVFWLEEPLHWYLQREDFARLAAAMPIPLAHGERELIGAVGVSGSPGGDKDEARAKAALDKAAGRLK